MQYFKKLTKRRFVKLSLAGSTYALLGCGGGGGGSDTDNDATGDTASTGKTVLVVGAGVSGLSAAKQLKADGFEVVLLEAADHMGGRLNTDHSFGAAFELGAGWIHGPNGNPISHLTSSASATTYVTNDESLLVYDGNGNEVEDSRLDQLDTDLEILLEQVDEYMEDRTDVSLEDAINAVNPNALNDELMVWGLTAFTEFDTGGPLELLSAANFDEDKEFDGADVILPNGYDAILTPLSEGLTVNLQHNVQQVEYTDSGVTITTDQGIFTGDYAVITVPLGVLKKGTITFSPSLPASMTSLINKVSMGNVTKALMKFDSAFWPTETQYLGYISDIKGKWPYFLNYRTFSDENLLLPLSFGEYPLIVEQKTDVEIQVEIMEILRTIFGSSIPDPTNFMVTRWSIDSNTYGAYTYTAVGNIASDFNNMTAPVSNRLFFAGEHTIFDYHATVHGAYLSGIAAATKIKALVS